MSSVPNKLSHKDIATLLLLLHGQLFGDESLVRITKLCEITFANENEHTRALWEWFYFGLYAVVKGVQNNFGNKPEVENAIVREMFSELRFHLVKGGFTSAELDGKLVAIKERFTQLDAFSALEKVNVWAMGHGVAGFVLGIKLSPGKAPPTSEAFGFSLAATESYIGTLKATNELFDSIKF
jgi:hypothetical protein